MYNIYLLHLFRAMRSRRSSVKHQFPAANNASVKVCTWSHDPRNIFADVGAARVQTALGEAYMAQTITLGRLYTQCQTRAKEQTSPVNL
ncbi:MAG: hypothetical protein ACKPKO_09030, partial [Candidatus Fonsibacter sp.]